MDDKFDDQHFRQEFHTSVSTLLSCPHLPRESITMAHIPSENLAEASSEWQAETEVKDWVYSQVQAEAARLKEAGIRCVVIRVNNCYTARRDTESEVAPPKMTRMQRRKVERKRGKRAAPPVSTPVSEADSTAKRLHETAAIVNTLDCETSQDFGVVEEIMTSPPQPIPSKPGYSMVFLILRTGHSFMLAPYMFIEQPENLLTSFVFINSKGATTAMSVEQMTAVSASPAPVEEQEAEEAEEA